MAMTDAPSRLLPLAEELLDGGRRKPKRTGRRMGLTLLGVAAAGAAVALAVNEELRNSVIGSARALGEEVVSGPADAQSYGAPA